MINTIDICAPLGKSDHSVLQFEFTHHAEMSNRRKSIPAYNKGDYTLMKQLIIDTDRETLLKGSRDNIDKQWEVFMETFHAIQKQCIPMRNVGSQNHNKKHCQGIDQKALQKINHKKSLWKLIRKSQATEQQKTEYNRVRNQVRRLTRKTKKHKERIKSRSTASAQLSAYAD